MRNAGAAAAVRRPPVPADLRSDDIVRALDSAGHDAAGPSLCVCEGPLVYLHQTAIERLLAGLRSSAAAGSVLAASTRGPTTCRWRISSSNGG